MGIVDLIFALAGLVIAVVALSVSRTVRVLVIESLAHPLRRAVLIKDTTGVRVEVQPEPTERGAHA